MKQKSKDLVPNQVLEQNTNPLAMNQDDLKRENQLTKVLNIPSVIHFTEKKLKKQGKNFIINILLTVTTMFILLGVIITIAIAIGIRLA
ncbi:hypothetical protein JM47_01285 [Ureaplasma diversum]|uniref:Uncharacterized protein n=2 Tax=Ureaplasma diversum TaxID=42094 RepID=A0A0C5RLF0_9BACT|nr:hypothetical protein JM47_01285 [Ureaplasma diversum]